MKIYFHENTKSIEVQIYVRPVPTFLGLWESKGHFVQDEWFKSDYATMIKDNDMQDLISWFWMDMHEDGQDSE